MLPKVVADEVGVMNGPFGFCLIIRQSDPDYSKLDDGEGTLQTKLTVVQEVRMSPLVAKIFLNSLATNLRRYEESFGEIRAPAQIPNPRDRH